MRPTAIRRGARTFVLLAVSILLLVEIGAPVAPAGHGVALDTKNVVLLRVHPSDYAAASRYTQAQVSGFFGQMSTLWTNTSYGDIALATQVTTLFAVPGTRADYATGDLSSATQFNRLLNDAITASPAGLDWSDVDAVGVVLAETSAAVYHRGQGTKCNLPMGPGGPVRYVGCFIGAENPSDNDLEVWGRWMHEVGHAFQGPGPAHPSNYNNQFELMDANLPGHTGAFEKQSHVGFQGWLPAAKYWTLPAATNTGSTCLRPIEEPTTASASPQAAKIEVTGSAYYLLSLHRRIRGDELNGWYQPGAGGFYGIPDEGLLITRVVEGGDTGYADQRWVAVQPADGGVNDLWDKGETYTNYTDGVTVAIQTGGTADSWCVDVGRFVPEPDVMITRWPAPAWETTDIWVDSPLNGYGTYRYGTRADGYGGTVPAGNGDDAAVNRANRVYARVRNVGTSPATDVVVTIERADPTGVGISGTWASLGTVTQAQFPGLASIPPGGFVDVYVTWNANVPTSSTGRFYHHTCLRVRIDPVAGEVVLGNQDGNGEQENLQYFEAPAGGSGSGSAAAADGPDAPSSALEHHSTFRLLNDAPVAREFLLSYQTALPDTWTVSVNAGILALRLAAGESRDIPIVVIAPPDQPAGSAHDVDVTAVTTRILRDDNAPENTHHDWIPVGGARLEGRAVEPTDVSCSASRTPTGQVHVTGRIDNAPRYSGYTIRQYEQYHAEVYPAPTVIALDGLDASGLPTSRTPTLLSVDAEGRFAGYLKQDQGFQAAAAAPTPAVFVDCIYAGSDVASSSWSPRVLIAPQLVVS